MAKNLYGALVAGGHHRDADVPGLRQRGHDHRDHAHHRRSPAADVSYGGSSVIVTLLALGLLQSIHAQARETALAKGRMTLL